MRPRFSLRTLLILFLAVSVACYVILVRPTVVANQFAQAVETKDFVKAESMFRDSSNHTLTESVDEKRTWSVEIERSPAEWSDMWRLQRRVCVRLKPDTALPGASDRFSVNFNAVATPLGINPGYPYPETLSR